jgi:hypothetical protein
MKTYMVNGQISPKAFLAAVLPTLGGVIAVGVQWAITGEFDRAELVTALSAVGSAALAFLGAYTAQPGPVSGTVSVSDDVRAGLGGEAGLSEVGIIIVAVVVAVAVFIILAATNVV